MDPSTIEVMKVVGPAGAFSIMLWVLLREQLKANREEMQKERDRNDANLSRLFAAIDRLAEGFELAKCKFSGECQYQMPQRREPHGPRPPPHNG